MGASEFVFLPPQLQHLRNSCLLQYILLVITQKYKYVNGNSNKSVNDYTSSHRTQQEVLI